MAVTYENRSPKRIEVVEDPRYLDHESPGQHPECPERLSAVREALRAFDSSLSRRVPEPADPTAILRVHTREHFETVRQACQAGNRQLDPDTFVSARSFETALLASGGTIELARAIARGEARTGFAVVRPPGHHAEAMRAMGFCLFNNVAVAARAMQVEEGLERILIVDWDVHHGNGTQHSFEEDNRVLFVSTHQFPFYPGTGDAGEIGRGPGEGYTLNIPLPAGCGDAEYVGAFARLLVPAAQAFQPEMILVSCGFDAHLDDPLASMRITQRGFLAMTRIVRALSDELCGGRIGFVLEGGYAPESLAEGTSALLEGLLETPNASPYDEFVLQPLQNPLRGVIDRVASAHRGRFPGLGAL